MSKLKNAPLLEVIFELRWNITNQADLGKVQYLHGDLYALLKDDFPVRESLIPAGFPSNLLVNSPSYRFRRKENGYPLFQIGPGILSLNTTDEFYEWEEYFSWCKALLSAFLKVYPYDKEESFRAGLIYIDFFKLDIAKQNILDFVNKNLSMELKQRFYKTTHLPKSLNFSTSFQTNLGQLSVALNTGKNSKQDDGLVLQTTLSSSDFQPDTSQIVDWLENSHEFSSNLFKEMTKGSLYNSFN